MSFPLRINVSWNEAKYENVAILKSTISCLLHRSHNDIIESNKFEEIEWVLSNILGIEYRATFLNDCLVEALWKIKIYKSLNLISSLA